MKVMLFLLCMVVICQCRAMDLNTVIPCNNNGCYSCYFNGSQQQYCTRCWEPYYFPDYKLGKCSLCSSVVAHCRSCTNNQTTRQCTTCLEGYFISPPNECKACSEVVPSCSNCSLLNQTQLGQTILANTVICTACSDNMHPSEDGQECLPCEIEHCSDCYRNGTDCFKCDFAYRLDSSTSCNLWVITYLAITCSICCGIPLCMFLSSKFYRKWQQRRRSQRKPIVLLLEEDLHSND